jgi:hypothetical protein
MVPTTVNDLANLIISLGYAMDGVTPVDIITILIDDVAYPVTAVLPVGTSSITMQGVVDIINNDTTVGPLVEATIEMSPGVGSVPILALRGRSTASGFITFRNDLSFIANWGPDNVVQDIAAVFVDVATPSVPGQLIDMLEPKPTSPAFDEVYIPYHTEVISDDPILDVNYWANVKYDSLDNANSVACSVVSATHPETGEDIVYIAYINYGDVVIEARYANGANSGQLVTGLTGNEIGFQPMPNGWIDSYWTQPRVLSTTLAFDSTTGRLFLKSIVSGAIYAESAYASVNTTVLSICELDPMLSNTVQWVHTVAHDTIQNVVQPGFGVFQRSDGGFVIDGDHNLIATSNILIPLTDSYYGTQSFAPGVDVTKLTPNGSLLWNKIIETGQYYDPMLDENHQIIEGEYVRQADRFFCMPAAVAVANDNIYVAHGTCFHKLDSNGDPLWTKEFDQLSLGNLSGTARLITDIQVHPTTNDVYVATAGFPTQSDSTAVIFKFPDTSVSDMTASTGATWLSPLPVQMSEPWGFDTQYEMYVPVSMKLDTTLNRLVVAAKLTRHGFDGYTSVNAGDMSVIVIDTASMGIVWSSDVSITSIGNATDISVAGPVMGKRQNFGYTAFDFVRVNGLVSGVCYGAPLYIGEGSVGQVSPAGLVVSQNFSAATVANNTNDTAAVHYIFEDHTSNDISANASYGAINGSPPVAVHNGFPLITNEATYATWHRESGVTTLTSTVYAQYADFTWVLPPTAMYNKTSLYVKNIAEVGELIITGEIPAPTSLMGTALDRAGSFRPAADGLYYCTDDYDGTTTVWKKLPFDASGGRIKLDPIGYNTTHATLSGCPTDKIGDIYIMEDVVLLCGDEYDGTSNIWNPVLPAYGTGLSVATNVYTNYDNTRPDLWPTGYYLNGYTVTIAAVQTAAPPSTSALYGTTTYLTTADPHGRSYASNVANDSYIYWNESYWAWPAGYTITITNATSNTSTGTFIQLVPPSGAIFANGMSPYIRAGESITIQRSATDSGTWVATSRVSPLRTIQFNSSAGSVIDPRRSYRYKISVNGAYTVPYPATYTPIDGEEFTLMVYNNGVAYTVGWNAGYRWAGGTAPAALSANRMHIVKFTFISNFWMGTVVAQNVPIV